MNTIEQAREVSTRLAERARRLSRTLRMRPRVGLDEESADTIDALIAENAALLAANRDCINHFDQIKEDYDKAVVELGATRRDRNELGDEEDVARQRYERAEAELAALKSQEPVAWAAQDTRTLKYHYIWHDESDVRGWINLQHQSRDDCTFRGPIPLYLAAGAQPAKSLSDAEITSIWREQIDTDGDYDSFARAIEQAHGIKEQP